MIKSLIFKRFSSALLVLVLVVGLLPGLTVDANAVSIGTSTEGAASINGVTIDRTIGAQQLYAVMFEEVTTGVTPTGITSLPEPETSRATRPVKQLYHVYNCGSRVYLEEPVCPGCGGKNFQTAWGAVNNPSPFRYDLGTLTESTGGQYKIPISALVFNRTFTTEPSGGGERFTGQQALQINAIRLWRYAKYLDDVAAWDYFPTEAEIKYSNEHGGEPIDSRLYEPNFIDAIGGYSKEVSYWWTNNNHNILPYGVFDPNDATAGYIIGDTTEIPAVVKSGSSPKVRIGTAEVGLPAIKNSPEFLALRPKEYTRLYHNLRITDEADGILQAEIWTRASSTAARYGVWMKPDGTPEKGSHMLFETYEYPTELSRKIIITDNVGPRTISVYCPVCRSYMPSICYSDLAGDEMANSAERIAAGTKSTGYSISSATFYTSSDRILNQETRAKVTGITFRDCVIKAMPDLNPERTSVARARGY